MADNVSIMAIRVVPEGDERDKDVANGIRYAVDNGARVINMSFGKGFKWNKEVVDDAVKYAEKKGVLLVNATRKTLELNPFRSQFTTSYYAGLDRLLEGLNPWLKGIALPGDSLRAVKGYSTDFLPWNQALWAYRLTGQAKWLQLAKRDADLFIQHKIYNNTNKLLSHIPFYNAIGYTQIIFLCSLRDNISSVQFID